MRADASAGRLLQSANCRCVPSLRATDSLKCTLSHIKSQSHPFAVSPLTPSSLQKARRQPAMAGHFRAADAQVT